MDRRLTFALALLGICGPPVAAQNTHLPRPAATFVTSDRVMIPIVNPYLAVPQAAAAIQTPASSRSMLRLPPPPRAENAPPAAPANDDATPPIQPQRPVANGRAARLVRLPASTSSADPRVPSTLRTPLEDEAVPSRLATRRYPSTERIPVAQPEQRVSAPVTYRWDPRDANLSAVANRAEKRIEAGFKLANRGALFGARAEFRKAILSVAEALDAQHRVTGHSQAYHEALQAIQEAADFSTSRAGSSGRVDQIVATHQTPVLKHACGEAMPALLAMQRYHAFAQQRLVAASGGAPVAASALYAMGKIHMALADSESQNELDAAKAMTFLQSAMMVDAGNYAAANELGVMLARFGHLREARECLRHSARVQPMPETWKNLEIVHHRLGEYELARRAREEWQRQTPSAPAVAGNGTAVQWVAPEAFAGRPSEAPTQPVVPPMTAEKSKEFSLWPWR